MRSKGARGWLTLAVAVAAIAAGLVPAVATAPGPPVEAAAPAGVRADDGATVVRERRVDERVLDLTVDSPALATTAQVRLLLPVDFASRPRWPVLYLLHGCCDTYDSWTRETDVRRLTEGVGVIVVMPEGGPAGFYSDWWNGGGLGAPAWEVFHLDELRQILERGYRAGERRAIAGLSMGGLGALSYAARRPGMFAAAASYSGVLHTRYVTPAGDDGADGIAILLRSNGLDPARLWGDPIAQRQVWAEHNPYDLADRLRGVAVYVSCGNGQPGPEDGSGGSPDSGEAFLLGEARAFVARAIELGVPVTTDFYGPGTHTWPYWQRGLHRSFPMLRAAIGA